VERLQNFLLYNKPCIKFLLFSVCKKGITTTTRKKSERKTFIKKRNTKKSYNVSKKIFDSPS
jgi:hypothetical protein